MVICAACLSDGARKAAGREAFRRDVLDGLRRPRKELPCKYFYDSRGSDLFEEICRLEEYYPTRCELDILESFSGEMADAAGPRCVLIEYGSGSSRKTRLLLDRLSDPAAYVPVDISGEHLAESAVQLARRYPSLHVLPVYGDFTAPIALPALPPDAGRRVLYFSGSTIGNFRPPEIVRLLRGMARLVAADGGLLIAVDLKKDAATLEAAYDDAQGVTAAFNLNLLTRINRELGGDFALDRFRHRAVYNVRRGRIEMYLVSLEPQTVHVGDAEFAFDPGEAIRTEYSYKFSLEEFARLAGKARLRVDRTWTDSQGCFSVQWLTAAGD